jgi:hypothetical protein
MSWLLAPLARPAFGQFYYFAWAFRRLPSTPSMLALVAKPIRSLALIFERQRNPVTVWSFDFERRHRLGSLFVARLKRPMVSEHIELKRLEQSKPSKSEQDGWRHQRAQKAY